MATTDQGLYLGDSLLPTASRHARLGSAVGLPLADLLTHVFVCGGSGFGKTVIGKAIVEGAALRGVPGLIVDLKGDLSSLAIPARDLLDAKGPPPALTSLLAESMEDHREGFLRAAAETSDYRSRCCEYASAVRVEVLTPRSDLVRPVALASFPTIDVPADKCDGVERQDYLELMRSFVDVFLSRVYGTGATSAKFKNEASLLQSLLEHAWSQGISLEGVAGLEELVRWIIAPPIQRVGALPIDLAMGDRERTNLARNINTQLVGLERDWHRGVPLDLDTLLRPKDGRTPIVILNVSHLHAFSDQAFVVAQVCYAIYRWMRKKGGSARPRLAFFLDEIGAGGGNQSFFPSAPYNPPSKTPLSIVLRQGRAFGVCCVLATQNVVGVDQRGLGNCATWIIGNLNSETDRSRVDKALGDASTGYAPLSSRMAALRPHEFLLRFRSGDLATFRERWLYSVHETIASTSLPMLAAYMIQRPDRRLESADAIVGGAAVGSLPSHRTPVDRPFAGEVLDRPPAVGEPPRPRKGIGGDVGDIAPTIICGATQTSAGSVPAWRVVIDAAGISKDFAAGETICIGRHPKCDVVLSDPAVSRRHLLFDFMSTCVGVSVDADAKNQTLIDGAAVPPGSTVLIERPESLLAVGQTRIRIARCEVLGP